MENLTVENFVPVILYALLVNGVLPLVAKMLPIRQQAQIQSQKREEERKDREVLALEKIEKTLTQSSERLLTIESGQTSMVKSLEEQSKALAVLVDRVSRPKATRTRKGD